MVEYIQAFNIIICLNQKKKEAIFQNKMKMYAEIGSLCRVPLSTLR